MTTAGVKEVALDLVKAAADKGMTVASVIVRRCAGIVTHEANRLRIALPARQPPARNSPAPRPIAASPAAACG